MLFTVDLFFDGMMHQIHRIGHREAGEHDGMVGHVHEPFHVRYVRVRLGVQEFVGIDVHYTRWDRITDILGYSRICSSFQLLWQRYGVLYRLAIDEGAGPEVEHIVRGGGTYGCQDGREDAAQMEFALYAHAEPLEPRVHVNA